MGGAAATVKKVSATKLRQRFKRYSKEAKGKRVILISNRRQEPKYLVDKAWLDQILRERASVMATLEILADRKLTDRLVRLARTIDEDIRAKRLYTMEEVFGQK